MLLRFRRERSERNNTVLNVLIIKIQNTCRYRIWWGRSLNYKYGTKERL